ncbi:MAG: triphosphoribosyl-dephospho-CoA synthase [Aureliella sp.]
MCNRSAFTPLLPFPFDRVWSIGQAIELACLLEASAAKVGNVHPGASFSDMHFSHFLASAVAIGPTFAVAEQQSVGQMVLDAVRATTSCVGRNTNLGTLLLFAPLAMAHKLDIAKRQLATIAQLTCSDLRASLENVLEQLTPEDCHNVYSAICIAAPGGLGTRDQDDVTGQAPDDLRAAMAAVADIDGVARQYVNNFEDIFTRIVPWLRQELTATVEPLEAVCRVQLRWLAHEVDGLIVRKAGMRVASEVQQRAQSIAEECLSNPAPLARQRGVRDFDRFLRTDGHRLNPGTTADLIAAAMLAMLLSSPNG